MLHRLPHRMLPLKQALLLLHIVRLDHTLQIDRMARLSHTSRINCTLKLKRSRMLQIWCTLRLLLSRTLRGKLHLPNTANLRLQSQI